MSYNYPAIKEYYFIVDKDSFEKKISLKIDSIQGWSLQKKDSIDWGAERCYWTRLFYRAKGKDLLYTIKYCFDSVTSIEGECSKIELLSVIDYKSKMDNHELSNKDVESFVGIVDGDIFNKLAPECSPLR
jgi:hypothetical protein